jgi:Flp pilus assembly protein TadG
MRTGKILAWRSGRVNHAGARLIRREDGGVLPMFGLLFIPLVMLVGAAIDYTRASTVKTSLQASLDAALLAGARDGSLSWTVTALNVFNGNPAPNNASVTAPQFNLDANRAYTATVSAAVPTAFLDIIGIQTLNVGAASTASVASASGHYYCIMALNPTAQAALQLTGNAAITVTAPKCVTQVNSNNSDAVDMTGNAWINDVENCFVGQLRTVGNASISPGPDAACKSIPDPFASYPTPTVGGCTYTNFSASGQQAMTLQPGVYCGGMSFSGPVNVTFAPGLYIVKDGVIKETGGSFTGNGVSFFLTGQGASIQLSGQANWHLVAPVGGPLPGFVIFLDPDGPSGLAASSSKLSGQAELYFEGIIYLPEQEVTVTGTAEAFAPSPYTSYIGDTLRFVGNGQLVINNDTSLTQLPIPTALYVQTNGQVALTR